MVVRAPGLDVALFGIVGLEVSSCIVHRKS
jgi:hypothetical protein